ncbi:hypothetical protein [Paenibacillus pectinilyticus]|uniref:hypothetical protein n=1 Tax=Paenibacillus pectinilyticus TaxID=512399 RepID=UPI00114CEA1F|nr:hypothetical protein [Paenibacillus pectinilyticus]
MNEISYPGVLIFANARRFSLFAGNKHVRRSYHTKYASIRIYKQAKLAYAARISDPDGFLF